MPLWLVEMLMQTYLLLNRMCKSHLNEFTSPSISHWIHFIFLKKSLPELLDWSMRTQFFPGLFRNSYARIFLTTILRMPFAFRFLALGKSCFSLLSFNSLLWELGMEIQPANTLLSEFLGHVFFAFQLLVWLLKTTMAFWFLFLSIKHFLSPFLYVSLKACRILSLAPCSEMSLLPALKCISYRHSGDPFNLVTYVLQFG